MSNSLAIATVTATLKNLLGAVREVVPGAIVTTLAPDRALEGTGNRLNLFLYQAAVNAAWRNMDLPPRVKPGEAGHPPLALNLTYLLTAYSEDDNDREFTNHRLLGQAMSILHDYPVLDREAIRNALRDNDLYEQVEQVRLTFQPLSVDEMSKLWTTFQAQYRPSVAYQASVVLIDSTLPVRAPLPVLQRGGEVRGVISQPDLIPPLPTLTQLELPGRQPSLQFRETVAGPGAAVVVGDELILHGHHLLGSDVKVRFNHPRVTGEDAEEIAGITPQPGNATATRISVKLSDTQNAVDKFPAGFYRLAVIVTQDEGGKQVTRVTNDQAFPLAPRITLPPGPMVGHMLTVNCKPLVWPGQQVALLLGSSEIQAPPRAAKSESLVFDIGGTPAGQYLVRLRVDGVDSLPVQDYTVVSPIFDPEQMVTIPEND